MTRKPLTDPPDRLTDEQRAAILLWIDAHREHRWARSRLVELEEACFDHFRAIGKPMADWPATLRSWIRRQPEFAPKTTPPSAFIPQRPVPAPFVPCVTPEERLERRRLEAEYRGTTTNAIGDVEPAKRRGVSPLAPLLQMILRDKKSS